MLTGEQAPDAQLMAASTVPVGIAAEAHAYLAHGGPANLDQLARFLSDTVLLTGHGFEPPAPAPSWGPLERTAPRGPRRQDGPTVAVLYYRAHHMSGNTAFVDALCGAIEDAGGRRAPAVRVLAARPRARALDELRRRRRHRDHRPGRRRHQARRRVGGRRRRVVGRGRAQPPSTYRSSRRSA